MDFSNPDQRRIFFELHQGLPRQSAGSDHSTLRALDLVRARLPEAPLIADMACGPGPSAIALAQALPEAQIWAIDLQQPFLDELAERASDKGVDGRIFPRCASMMKGAQELEALDMIWCEGGIYNLGVLEGLVGWRRLLKPGGIVVFNEPIWLLPAQMRAPEVEAFWRIYPRMMDQQLVESLIATAAYTLLGGFDLPESDWWEAYYTPLEARLSEIEAKNGLSEVSAPPIAHTRKEIDIRRRYAEAYNYRFFAVQMR